MVKKASIEADLMEARKIVSDFARSQEPGVNLTNLQCSVRFGVLMRLLQEIDRLRGDMVVTRQLAGFKEVPL